MKKILILLFLLLTTACTTFDITNTPTKKAEEFLNKYQILHEDVINDLDKVLKDKQFNEANQEEYRNLIKKQYKDMQYEIKETNEDGDEAIVIAEIIVKDYTKIIKEAENYKQLDPAAFYINDIYSEDKYQEYLISRLTEAKDKITYQIELKLHKDNNKWKILPISETTEDKILGIYNY